AVIDAGSPSPVALGLAHTVKILAEVDRGDYERSLESLRKAVADGPGQAGAARADLPTEEVVEICDAYNQRLLQAARYEEAKKALKTLLESTRRPALKEF